MASLLGLGELDVITMNHFAAILSESLFKGYEVDRSLHPLVAYLNVVNFITGIEYILDRCHGQIQSRHLEILNLFSLGHLNVVGELRCSVLQIIIFLDQSFNSHRLPGCVP